MPNRLLLFIVFCSSASALHTQNVSDSTIRQIPSKYIDKVSSKAEGIQDKLDKKSQKALSELKKQELKMKGKLQKIDSLAAKYVFADADKKYSELTRCLQNTSAKQYIPGLDSLATSLKFLQANPHLVSEAKDVKEKLAAALKKVNGLEGQLQKAEEIKKFLKERRQLLKDQLTKFGFTKELKKLNKQVYYYAQQLNEYKAILNDPKKVERKALELLSKTKVFREFMRKNSMLASLFRMPGDPIDPAYIASLSGLQTRAQVNTFLQQQIALSGPSGMQQFRQQLQNAQGRLTEAKNKLAKFGSGNSEDILPEGFKPNREKTRGFLKRLEFGTTLQSQKASYFFPATSDIGLSLGYKLNSKSVIGIGISYKLGLGRGWEHIKFSSEGLAVRSFIDWKAPFEKSKSRLLRDLWISGGYEMNYRTAFEHFDQLRNLNAWQRSGLLGISKKIPVRSSFFKNTKVQVLWDFMAKEQRPQAQNFIFRIGYEFNKL